MSKIPVDAMATAVLKATGLSESRWKEVAQAISSVWDDKVALIWTREDIVRVCDEQGWARPTSRDCNKVMESILLETDRAVENTIAKHLRDEGLTVPK